MKKILIVEDHEDFRMIVKQHLKDRNIGDEIIEADSAEMGIALAVRERPQIVLMDIRLPEMNGIDAAVKIKELVPTCQIIVLTMFETEIFKHVFKSDAVTAYLGKSEIYEKLITTITQAWGKG